jgi:crotonobetainyl-CoA:carnitine CoA-transferase CaiB-like acyl-CoA transferase
MDVPDLPLTGLRVIEFTHMVMGPSAGLVLADLGADVVKVEPKGGDRTRQLLGSGAGYFPMFNRNKRSVCLDLKSPEGREAAERLCMQADIVVENFRGGTLERLGLGYADLKAKNPRVIFCAAKGFLRGPYEDRTALDEVAQMMGGLAYMTGPPGRPLRAGTSVIDIAGGMFGVIGILAALERRHRTGLGGEVKCALFESTAFLVGQHMAQRAVTGQSAQPMPARISAWAIYDVFETARPDEQLFVGVVSDSQWGAFCQEFQLPDLLANPDYATNNKRVHARKQLLPKVRSLFGQYSRETLAERLESIGLPFAPIMRPDDLFEDPHLLAGGGLLNVTIGEKMTTLPATPIEFDGARMPLRHDIPAAGAHNRDVLREVGFSDLEIDRLIE